uniref:Uncharacterized protein n=1 Tax=Panagrolaimus sp. PS1159 TaxID=55785 RepID=A0AC35GCS8_9BILA
MYYLKKLIIFSIFRKNLRKSVPRKYFRTSLFPGVSKCIIGLAPTFKLIVSDNHKDRKKLKLLNKSSYFSILNDKAVENEKNKKQWKNGVTNTNNSTLSLHISAYESSIETASNTSDSFGIDKCNESLKRKNAKQIFSISTFYFQNPFEFLRQQSDEVPEPEVSKYRANQRLLYPETETVTGTDGSTKTFAGIVLKESRISVHPGFQ